MSNGDLPQCPTGSCGYGMLKGDGPCDPGTSSCANGRLAPPDAIFGADSYALKNVTERINDRLARLGPDPDGRKLSFLRTPIGIAVGWLRHVPDSEQHQPNPDYIRADDPRVVDELMIDRSVSPGDRSAAGTWEYQVTDDGIVTCTPGPEANCWLGPFLVADTHAPYHPPAVREVVEFMIDELNQLSKDAQGRKIALIRRGEGVMLAWVTQQGQSAPMTV